MCVLIRDHWVGYFSYEHSFRTQLRVRHAADVVYLDEKDFNEIGMSRLEQKRLKAAYQRKFSKGSIMEKLKKKILGKGVRFNCFTDQQKKWLSLVQ